jgi:hypothetical protein
MRFCYQIHSHRSPEQILRLTSTIKQYSPESFVLISHDRNGATLDVDALEGMPGVAVLFHDANYGSYTSVQRYMSSLDWMISEGVEADWVVNLSGEDYPLVPPDLSEREVVESGKDGFMEHWEMLGPDAHWPRRRVISRYHYQHRLVRPLTARQKERLRPIQAINRVQPFFRVHVAYGLVVGTRGDAPFGPDFRLYGGSNFATLSWPLVAYLHEYLAAHPELVEYFRHVLTPDEMVVKTVLCNAPQFRSGEWQIDPDCKRYFDFTRSKLNHPKWLGAEDLPLAYASGAHWARKFDGPTSGEVLDSIDRHLAELHRRDQRHVGAEPDVAG